MFRSTLNIVFSVAFAIWLTPMVLGHQAYAQPKAVTELFTSQSCSSCQPADRLLVELARDPSLVALSWHVDYWNNLGWKDTFSEPAFTARQKAYGAVRGDGDVYTPQAVVNGLSQVVGSDHSQIDAAIANQRGSEPTVPLTLRRNEWPVRL